MPKLKKKPKKKEVTKVIFRKWPNGGIIAIFPEEIGDTSAYTCMMYQHIGQHSAGDPVGVIHRTKRATPSEYRDLLRELRQIGYKNLKVAERYSRSSLDVRRRKLRAL